MKGCMSHSGSLALTSFLGVFIADERLFFPSVTHWYTNVCVCLSERGGGLDAGHNPTECLWECGAFLLRARCNLGGMAICTVKCVCVYLHSDSKAALWAVLLYIWTQELGHLKHSQLRESLNLCNLLAFTQFFLIALRNWKCCLLLLNCVLASPIGTWGIWQVSERIHKFIHKFQVAVCMPAWWVKKKWRQMLFDNPSGSSGTVTEYFLSALSRFEEECHGSHSSWAVQAGRSRPQ